MTDKEARRTPHELVFGGDRIDDRLFPPIAEEAEARGEPIDDPDRFVFLSSVGSLLRAIGGEPEEAGEAMRLHGRLLYHAFHFWRDGKRLLTLDRDSARSLVDDAPDAPGWTLTAPSGAGYVQLPPNLFWAAPAEGLRPEPADGFFWVLSGPDDHPAVLRVLLVLGMRPDRPGLSVVPAEGPVEEPAGWLTTRARPEGQDFASTLPGGELDRLYSIETVAELLKLASLAFWHGRSP